MHKLPHIFRTYKFRLLPSKYQHAALVHLLEEQRVLYNAALFERIDCYRKTGAARSYIAQCASLTILREAEQYRAVPLNIQRWTIKRLDEAYSGFFRRVKKGEKAGFPRFRGQNRWSSFGFNQMSGLRFDGQRIRFRGLPGALRVHMHRPLPDDAEIKSAVFKRDHKGWSVCFQVAISRHDRKHNGPEVGIDVGINVFAALSTGEAIPNPRIAQRRERELRRLARALSRCQRNSKRRQKVRAQVRRHYADTANARRTFLHQQSARIAREFGVIAVEDLKISNLVRSGLGKQIRDASWGTFVSFLEHKAESAGGRVIRVNPKNTSQACSGCGELVPKGRGVRLHSCPSCGLEMDRDENAARNILSRAVAGPDRLNVTECRVRADKNIGAS